MHHAGLPRALCYTRHYRRYAAATQLDISRKGAKTQRRTSSFPFASLRLCVGHPPPLRLCVIPVPACDTSRPGVQCPPKVDITHAYARVPPVRCATHPHPAARRPAQRASRRLPARLRLVLDAWSIGQINVAPGPHPAHPDPGAGHGAAELLALYPQLARAARLTPGQAAFVAGYMGHLLVDEIWYHRIFEPHSLAATPPLERRLVCHNVLRLYHENQLQAQLEAGPGQRAGGNSQPVYDFPLLSDAELRQWRDRLGVENAPRRPQAQRRSLRQTAARARRAPSGALDRRGCL